MDIKLLIPLWGLADYMLDMEREENKAPIVLGLALYNGVILFTLGQLLGL